MITVKNRTRQHKISEQWIKKNIAEMLVAAGYPDFDLGILLTTNKTIQRYNKDFRKKDCATDVLSFPFHHKLKPGGKIIIKSEEDKNLGDIIISLEKTKSDADELGVSLKDRVLVLLAHGIAHLLGHDHKTDGQHSAMQKFEKKLLA
ncbi:rRNA maturation RNase YbeY [bacterium]|nr:rRNA maturation RNase YbeY [bacterium]